MGDSECGKTGKTGKDIVNLNRIEFPVELVKAYQDLLGNRDDFTPETTGAELYLNDGTILTQEQPPSVIRLHGNTQMEVSLDRPIHRAAVSALVTWLGEHLNLAISDNTDSMGIRKPKEQRTDRFDYMGDRYLSFGTDGFFDDEGQRTFIQTAQLPPGPILRVLNEQMRRTGRYDFDVLFMTRKDERGVHHVPVFIAAPGFQTDNPTEYEHHSDRVFFGQLFNNIQVCALGEHADLIAEFYAKYALSGFPLPNRKEVD